VKIAAAPHDQKVAMGQLDDAVEQCTRVGPLSRLLLEYPDAVTPVMETLRNTLVEYTREGVVHMDSAVWMVTARRAC
jgi:hypothetical protein